MATIRKVLGQSSPLATTNTTLYTVPSATDTVVSSIVVCNRGAAETYFRVAVRPAGEAIADKHYLYYDVIVASGDTFAATLGLTLATTDVVTVYATAATLSFNLFGQENS
jgi:glucose-6-phosphate dehydrogenase assembly protein OpcA